MAARSDGRGPNSVGDLRSYDSWRHAVVTTELSMDWNHPWIGLDWIGSETHFQKQCYFLFKYASTKLQSACTDSSHVFIARL